MQHFVDMKAVSSGDGSKDRPFQKINETSRSSAQRRKTFRNSCVCSADREDGPHSSYSHDEYSFPQNDGRRDHTERAEE